MNDPILYDQAGPGGRDVARSARPHGRMGGEMRRSFHHSDFTAEWVEQTKGGRTVSVCLPARDSFSLVPNLGFNRYTSLVIYHPP